LKVRSLLPINVDCLESYSTYYSLFTDRALIFIVVVKLMFKNSLPCSIERAGLKPIFLSCTENRIFLLAASFEAV